MHLKLVKNQEKYWNFIRNLRNNLKVKNGFIEQDHISKDEHWSFMSNYGHNYYVCLADEQPAGFVGSINGDIRVATSPDYQGKGIGKFMINEIMLKFPNSYAKVKLNNQASLSVFESCGFKKKYLILER
jgi:GNAT superfamily N-acetyltransferase